MNVENKQSEILSNRTFKKRDGTSEGIYGYDYEITLSMLYLLHGLRGESDFWLASNIEGFGAFDDIFLNMKIKTSRELFWFKLSIAISLDFQRILHLEICLLMETIESDKKRILD